MNWRRSVRDPEKCLTPTGRPRQEDAGSGTFLRPPLGAMLGPCLQRGLLTARTYVNENKSWVFSVANEDYYQTDTDSGHSYGDHRPSGTTANRRSDAGFDHPLANHGPGDITMT